MGATRSIYKLFRSIIFTAVLVVVGVIAVVYIVVSIPAVQNKIRKTAEKELTSFLGGNVEISQVEIKPFNEVILHGVSIYEPQGKRCISVGKIGAGISLWQLIKSGTVEITYAELISLNAKIRQDHKNGPLNIDFLIKAFSSKDKNSPPPKFRVILRNVVIRKSSVSFDRAYLPHGKTDRIDFNHLELNNFNADVAMPLIANDDFTIDMRRLAFEEKSGFKVRSITFFAHVTPQNISVKDIALKLDKSRIRISDVNVKIDGYGDLENQLCHGSHSLEINANPLIPEEIAAFYSPLNDFSEPLFMDVKAAGNLNDIESLVFNLDFPAYDSAILLAGNVENLRDKEHIRGRLDKLKLSTDSRLINRIMSLFNPENTGLHTMVDAIGRIQLDADASFDIGASKGTFDSNIITSAGNLNLNADLSWNKSNDYLASEFKLNAEKVQLGKLLKQEKLGQVSIDIDGNLSKSHQLWEGDIFLNIPYLEFNSVAFEDIYAEVHKNQNELTANLNVDNNYVSVITDAYCLLAGSESTLKLNLDCKNIVPSFLKTGPKSSDVSLAGFLTADITGNSIDNLIGDISLAHLTVKGKKSINLDNIDISVSKIENIRSYKLDSDVISGEISGEFVPTEMVTLVRNLISRSIPTILPEKKMPDCDDQYADISFTINPNDDFYSSLGIPVRPGVPVEIRGTISGSQKTLDLDLNAPYIVQGKNKLIKNTDLSVSLSDSAPSNVLLSSLFPLKKANANFSIDLSTFDNHSDIIFGWIMENNEDNRGEIKMGVDLTRNTADNNLAVKLLIDRSDFTLNDEVWEIYPSVFDYSYKNLSVDNFKISNNRQFIEINGRATDSPYDMLNVELAGIDLNYIFDILNINYVNFGGIASGKAHVSDIFSKTPLAYTEYLFVKDLKYNDCLLGDGDLEGHWDNAEKMVAINAEIKGDHDSRATVNGGVYVTRDSLAFDFDADRIDVAFMKPFVDGFTSDIRGKGSGHVSMFGTFSDIDLVGKAYADSVSMLIDFTNVYYTGSDTVFFYPGRISIPRMELSDKYGNTCMMSGEVTHDFLHNAKFNFEARNAHHLLVYDTSSSFNPKWYGHVFANGTAVIRGVPGYVSVNMNMSTADNSEFTFVLDENETALNYSFLTFSDRRREAIEAIEVKESFEDKLRAKSEKNLRERPTVFAMDLALEATPGATMVIVMDPKAGDKITGNGRGPLLMHYDTESDKLTMYGKYSLLSGNYNFSLQELILKNFTIQEGSSISFNGDPLRGLLDITASYRVNTNLADLDESFKNDPDLTRTTIPVDALLKVTGEIDAPEINFDLALPTVTSDVERKLRSIVSTDDMINQQIIYLLALNRFYSPDYTNASQGGEWASVASATISAQIQNIIGSMTDKFSLAPSFKSEKDNFSDIEVDVALSSSLFNNRLLINGNLGYRDKSTSQTNFIGDFDIEYLLSRDGKLRLKAYNHFNDASYYLKSALTTQGIGVVYRKDFDDPLSFVKRWLRRKEENNINSDQTKK